MEFGLNGTSRGSRHSGIWALTRTAVTFLAIILSLINVILHPLYRVAVDHRDVVLVSDVNYLVDM